MVEVNNQSGKRISVKSVKRVCGFFLKHYKIAGKDLSIALVDDKEMKKLNKKYRGKNSPTDVLSFSEEKTPAGFGDNFLGEIILGYDQIARQAKENKKTLNEELRFILIHGLLHLIGETDDTEEERTRMIKKGEGLIALMDKKDVQPKKAQKKL